MSGVNVQRSTPVVGWYLNARVMKGVVGIPPKMGHQPGMSFSVQGDFILCLNVLVMIGGNLHVRLFNLRENYCQNS